MLAPRWSVISQSSFAWEREALDYIRAHLPDNEPWRAWSNLEFIDDEGRVNEVDLLVLAPAGLILVEIKSRPGTVSGDAHTWTWRTEGRPYSMDNPLPLAIRKAKRLSSVLRRQEVLTGRNVPRGAAPWIEPLIFLSNVRQKPAIDPGTANRVVLPGNPGAADDPEIIVTLLRADELGLGRRGPVDSAAARIIVRALEQARIRPPGRGRRVGDFELEKLLTEGDNWQDFAARHAATGVSRRVRIYPYARAASPEARDRLARTAQRESRILEGVEHPGIQRSPDYREAELGPALVFEYDPAAPRLDRFLSLKQHDLSLVRKLLPIRQLGEAVAYAHGKRLYHRGLAPQNIPVRGPDTDEPRLQITNWQVASRGEGDAAPVLLLGGRSWKVMNADWPRRRVSVTPADGGGRSRWLGGGRMLSRSICRTEERIVAGLVPGCNLSVRAAARLAEIRERLEFVDRQSLPIVSDGNGGATIWTFAGGLAAASLANALGQSGLPRVRWDDLSVTVPVGDSHSVSRALGQVDPQDAYPVLPDDLERALKFGLCLPPPVSRCVLAARTSAATAVAEVLSRRHRRIAVDGPMP